MRIIIMGTGPFAVPSCQRLVEAGHDVALVVVRPAVNKKALIAPVQLWAEHAGLPLAQPASVNSPEAIEMLRSLDAQLYFVCDYGQILSHECLSVPPLGGINLHGSLLPRHRGAAPVQWTLLSGDARAGVSVIHMTPGLDAGPILTTRAVDVLPDENAGQLESRLSPLGAEATVDAIQLLDAWDGKSQIGVVQDKTYATKAPRLSKQDGRLNFSLPAAELERRVRGYQPWPGAYAELIYSETKRVSLHLRAARSIELVGQSNQRQIGAVWQATAAELGGSSTTWNPPWDHLLVVQTGRGQLAVSVIQAAGKRAMTVGEFLRGHPLTPAAHFAIDALADR